MEEDEDAKAVFGIQKHMCRCCLNSSQHSMVYAPSIREAFLELAGINVETCDGLPQWICSQCLTLLRKAVRFRRRILHTDNVLRDYLRRCAPFPIDERDPELSKYATRPLSQTKILQFNTDKTKNGYHSVLQHAKPPSPKADVPCKLEYEEPLVKLEDRYSDNEDDLPLMELRSNREDSVLGDDGMGDDTPSEPGKRKKESKSRKRKKKKRENESENQDETYSNVSILEPLESNDPLESIEEKPNYDKIEITDENFQKRLNKKHHRKYINVYKEFLRWKQEKNITAFTENVFLTYFNELELKNKPPTLFNIYTMLKATVLAQNGVDLGNFAKLKSFLKVKNKGVKSKVFTKDDVDRFLKTAPDDMFLTSKVILIIGICGGCFSSELLNLTVNDLEMHDNLILVKIQEKNNKERSFMIPENYSEYVKKYINIRPKDLDIDRFFIHNKDGNFVKMPMGKSKLAAIPKEVAMFLKFQKAEEFTCSCFRRTFHALFESKNGSGNNFMDSESESENRENDSKTTNNYAIAKKDDGVANSYDATANSSYTTAHNDKMVNDDEEFTYKASNGRIIKVPEKSKRHYVRTYDVFTVWLQKKSIVNITEEIMLEYFKHLTEEFQPSSLWNTFSMLRNTILTRNGVDIKKFERLKQFLRSNIVGFKKKSSKVLTESEIDTFLCSAPDYNYLTMKVVLLLGICGSCTGQELLNLTIDNVKLHKKCIVVKVKECTNKIRRFTITGHYYGYVRRHPATYILSFIAIGLLVFADENTDSLDDIEGVKSRYGIRKRLELDPQKIRVITLNPEEQIRQREEETKNITNFMYHCKLCFKGFNFESKLENHMKKHSPSRGEYLCTVCQMYLPTMYSYRVHMLIHTHRYECVVCERRMIDKQSIYHHYRTQHEGITTIIKCDICGKESSNDRTHRSHMRNHHSGTRPECDQCGKTFINKDSLTAHILIHNGEKKHACPVCDKRCLSRSHVKHHMKAHSDIKEFYCVECDVRFKTASNLRVHLTKSLKHKDEMSFKFPCSECPRRFESSARLSEHTRVQHLGVRAHACPAPACGARLATRAGLLAHARSVHARRRPAPSHVCHTCGRAFRGKSILTNHLRTHTGEKPYTCGVCARSFSQRTALRTHHKLVHLKVKHNQKQQPPSVVEKSEQLFPKSEPQTTFDGWTRPCELYYPAT